VGARQHGQGSQRQDRQAAEAVRARIDRKYLLTLDLADPGFDHSPLCEFRGRLLGGDAAKRPNQQTGSSNSLPWCEPPGDNARIAASWMT